jgi:hypothetical protein
VESFLLAGGVAVGCLLLLLLALWSRLLLLLLVSTAAELEPAEEEEEECMPGHTRHHKVEGTCQLILLTAVLRIRDILYQLKKYLFFLIFLPLDPDLHPQSH